MSWGMKTKERILLTSVELFNLHGVNPITTNHIAKELKMSPGNLYFHYRNKEEIIAELFKLMCKDTYKVWAVKRIKSTSPISFIEENFELYWKYRFFHREMYSLRRKDPQLSLLWRQHLRKMMKLMVVLYHRWVNKGYMRSIENLSEMQFIAETTLAMATTYLQFFESSERQPGKTSIERGKRHVARILWPNTIGETKTHFEKFIHQD